MKKGLVLTFWFLLMIALVGCSNSNTTNEKSNNEGKFQQTESTKPAAKEKPVLRQLMPYSRFDPNNYVVSDFLRETTGFEVKYDMLPVENADEKLNLLMANQEPYDFIKISPGQFSHLALSGALEPLDDLIEQYGSNMKQVISEASWQGAMMNGKIYAIPESSASGISVGHALIYRQDWLDELQLQPPTNLDELVDVLRQIKDKKQVIPLSGGKDPFQGEVGVALGWMYGVGNHFKIENDQIIHMVEDENTIEYLTFMNELYMEGLLDPEWAINQSNILIERFASGQSFMYREGWWNAANISNALAANYPDATIGILPPMSDSNGKRGASASGGIENFVAIPAWSANKEATMQYLDMKFEESTFKELAIGEEGKHHTVEDGKYFPILPIFEDERNFSDQMLTGIDEERYPVYWQARVRKNPHVQQFFETMQQHGEGIMYYNPLTFAPPIADVTKYMPKVSKLAEDEFIKFITGAEPISNYHKFLELWRAEGGTEMMQAANEWYKSTK